MERSFVVRKESNTLYRVGQLPYPPVGPDYVLVTKDDSGMWFVDYSCPTKESWYVDTLEEGIALAVQHMLEEWPLTQSSVEVIRE